MSAPALFRRTGGDDFPIHLKALLTGPPKSGKTTALGSVPNIVVLDTEPHANNLQSIAHLAVPYLTINSSDDLQKARIVLSNADLRRKAAEQLGMPDIEAVAIDTLDSLQAILKRERMAEQHTSKFLRDDWGWLKEQMKKVVEAFTALPMHVFFTVHVKSKDIGTEDNPQSMMLPGLEGAIAEEIAGMVGYSLLSFRTQEVRPDGSAYTKYWIRAEGNDTYQFLGNRAAGQLPDVIEPNFAAIYGAAMEGVKRARAMAPSTPAVAIEAAPPAQPTQSQQVVQAIQQAPQEGAQSLRPPADTAPALAAEPAPAEQHATPDGQPTDVKPGDGEPMNATALGHVKRVYDAVGLQFPQDKVEQLTLGQARNLVVFWKAAQADAVEGKLERSAAEEMTLYLEAQGWLTDADSTRHQAAQEGAQTLRPQSEQPSEPANQAPVADPSGTVEQVLAWVGDDRERAQEAFNLEHKKTRPRMTLLNQLHNRGAVQSEPAAPAVQQAAAAVAEQAIAAAPQVTPAAPDVEVPQVEEPAAPEVVHRALSLVQGHLGGVPIDTEGKPAPCEECGGVVDDEDIASLSQARFSRRLCVKDYVQETKKPR